MKSKLLNALKKAARRDKIRMHMPGAKGRRLGFLNGIFRYDFTEIDGLDNLYAPNSILKVSQHEVAADIGAADVLYLVNGSSAGVLAMLAQFKQQTVLMARDFHISAANAIDLFEINPIFVVPKENDIASVITPEQIRDALEENKAIKAVYLTYPNYYGYCVNLKAIVSIAHEKDIPVIVDAAHSACFPYSTLLPDAPALTGLDAWVVSTHKTLPAMNQAAYLAVSKTSRITSANLKDSVNTLQTTSPSYPILASIDFAKTYMKQKGEKRIKRLLKAIGVYSNKIDTLTNFSVIQHEKKDPLKWVVEYSETGLSLNEINARLNQRGIYVESIDTRYILMLLSPADNRKTIRRVYRTLKTIKQSVAAQKPEKIKQYLSLKNEKPLNKETVWIPLESALGRIAAKPAAVYPPGVPMVLKGDILNEEAIATLRKVRESGLSIIGIVDGKISVYDERIPKQHK